MGGLNRRCVKARLLYRVFVWVHWRMCDNGRVALGKLDSTRTVRVDRSTAFIANDKCEPHEIIFKVTVKLCLC